MPHVITGTLKDYDWGAVDGLARWHGATGGPQAELWFGVHPAGPSVVVDGPDRGACLADLPEHRGMPMVKILAAAAPLSIQVHPDAAAAERGWSSGSSLYADDAEKSEMLVALEPFHVHAGWRDAQRAADALANAGVEPGIVALVAAADHGGALRRLLALDPAAIQASVARIVDAAIDAGWPRVDADALARVAAAYPADPGVLATVLLAHDVISPGDGLAVRAGVVHSYVGGLGVEVMTSSDNVLRLGLTGKQIAVEEAIAAIRADRAPVPMPGDPGTVLAPEGMPFDLEILEGHTTRATGRHRLALALDGDLGVVGLGSVGEGCAVVWGPGEPVAELESAGRAIVVTGQA